MGFINVIKKGLCVALTVSLISGSCRLEAIANTSSEDEAYSFEQGIAEANETMLQMNKKWESIKEVYPVGSKEKDSLKFAGKVFEVLFDSSLPESVNHIESYKFDSYSAYNLSIVGQIACDERGNISKKNVSKLLGNAMAGDIIQTARYKVGTDIYANHTMVVEAVSDDTITVYHAGISGTVAESVYDITSFTDSYVCGEDKGDGVGITVYRFSGKTDLYDTADTAICTNNSLLEDNLSLTDSSESDKAAEHTDLDEADYIEDTEDNENDRKIEVIEVDEKNIIEESSDNVTDEIAAEETEGAFDVEAGAAEETEDVDIVDTEAEDEEAYSEDALVQEDLEIIDELKNTYEDAYMYDDDTICFTNDGGEQIYVDKDDPEIFKHFIEIEEEDLIEEESVEDVLANEFYANGTTTQSPFTNKSYVHDAKFSSYSILNGIDVSRHNGTIDWAKAKKGGVDFAFVRIGYRGYGAEGNIPSAGDDKAVTNIKAAYNAGVKVGVYFFSQAITVAEGKEEADFCINFIKKNNLSKYITLPVIIDYEYYVSNQGRLYNAKLSASAHQAICDSFASTIYNAGMTPGVYANYSMLKDDMQPSRSADYTKYWVARWNTATYYTGNYNFWQYSDCGSVPGISGAVDSDFYYEVKQQPKPEIKPVEIAYSLKKPTKTTYNIGEKLSLAGAYLLSSEGSKVTITNSMISGFSSDKAGVKTVNVNFGGKIYSFDILVNEFGFSKDAMYGATLKDINLPDVSYGKLSWKKTEKTPVGAVGINKFTVVFTPDDARFSKYEFSGYITVKHSIGDGVNETADVVVSYNEQIVANKNRSQKVLNSIRHKKVLKKDTDYTAELFTNNAFDENGNSIKSGTLIESCMIPLGYTGTFKIVITANGNYLGKIEKDIYVSEKSTLLKNAVVTLGSKLKNIDYTDFDENMFVPAVYDSKTKSYYRVEEGKITDTVLSKDEVKYAYTVKIANRYLIAGSDFEIASYGGKFVGNKNFVIKGVNGYLGTKKASYKIKGIVLTASKIKVEGIENKIYDGSAKYNDEVIVSYKASANSEAVILKKDIDYAITYSDNTNPGTAKMSITGLAAAGYTGKVTKNFKILTK